MKSSKKVIFLVLVGTFGIFIYSFSDSTIRMAPSIIQPLQSDIHLIRSESTRSEIKVIHRMNSHNIRPNTIHLTCGDYKCTVLDGSTNTSGSDLTIFSEVDIRHYEDPPIKGPQDVWAFFSKEPQIKMKGSERQKKWNGLFNYTATFLRDNEGSGHIFRPNVLIKSPPDKQYFTPKPNMQPLRALWFVSHCTTPSQRHLVFSAREEYVLELSKYITIDIYSSPKKHDCSDRFGDLVKNQSGEVQPKMEDYMFYLSFENNLCQDYVTEKLWKVLESNSTTIPIALGGLSIEDYELVAPPNSFIHVRNFTSPEALAKHLKFVSEDDNAFHYYNQWRNEYRLRAHHMGNHGDFMCYFCQLAYERPHRVWNTFSKEYYYDQCVDVSEPKSHCSYYNLPCGDV